MKNKSPTNTLNIIAIVLGALSLPLAFVLPPLVGVTGILGIIFAYVKKGENFRKSNTWAFVLNVISLFIAIIMLLLWVIGIILFSSLAGTV
ncbi:MAG: hypothetical protein PHW73_09845 [Atribacterota bacterium]|nr:hypothetical protein [Atribacterota bacterium]